MKIKTFAAFIIVLILSANCFSIHSEAPAEIKKGDINGDGIINGVDNVLLLQYIAGWDVIIDAGAADIDKDRKITGKDATILSQYLAGWEVDLEGEFYNDNPVLTFVIDDLSPNDYKYRNYFSSRNIAPTIPVVTSYIKEYEGSYTENATLRQLLELQNEYGYEFGSHTLTHPRNLTEMSDEELRLQLSESQNWMINHGLACDNFFVPFGNYNDKVLDMASEYYRGIRTSDNRNPIINDGSNLNLKNLHTVWLDAESTGGNDMVKIQKAVDEFKGYIDQAVQMGSNAWLIISFHTNSVNNFWMDNCFSAVADYAIEKDINIQTFNKALTHFGVPEKEHKPPVSDSAPEISGVSDVTIEAGDPFDILKDITAFDAEDGDLTGKIQITGNFDTTQEGVYRITYSVTDSSGNTVSRLRTLTVLSKPPVTDPDPLLRVIKDAKGNIIAEDRYTADGKSIIRAVGTVTFSGASAEDWLIYPKINNTDKANGNLTYSFRICLKDARGAALLKSGLPEDSVNVYSKSIALPAKSFYEMRKDAPSKAVWGVTTAEISELIGGNYTALPYIVVRLSGITPTNVTGLKNYLLKNTLTVWYPLQNEITEPAP